jgi:CRISPR-associated protein Csm4
MRYYKAIIKPRSPFATEPVSDTIFGQLCWILKYIGQDLNALLADYTSEPFCVVSDMFLNDCGNAVKIPLETPKGSKFEKLEKLVNRKELKNGMLSISSLFQGKIEQTKSATAKHTVEIVHNSINRITGTTGEGGFAPFSSIETFYDDAAWFSLYLYIKDDSHRSMIEDAIKLMGKYGYGKDSSIGKGRFDVVSFEPVDFEMKGSGFYTLGNCVLESCDYKDAYYEICTRFGKHGGDFVFTGNPFKNPVVMARQGALVMLSTSDRDKAFIGKAVTGLSRFTETVHQGYSLCIPYKVVTA